MELITFESEAYKAMLFEITQNHKKTDAIIAQLNARSVDKWLSPTEAAEYTGFTPRWIKERSALIGAFQDGKGLRYKRSNLDKYMEANSFKR